MNAVQKPSIEIKWHPQQEELLRKWAEIATCYRWMYDRAYRDYTSKNMGFAIPVIVLSTITGTANFAHESFPENWQNLAPMAIGSLNLIAGLLTTVSQFLRINELQEGHRVASIGFAKFGRNIRVALNLPHKTMQGEEFVEMMRQEYDRLLEQSPSIPTKILLQFQSSFKNLDLEMPEIVSVRPVKVFKEEIQKDWMEMKVNEIRDTSLRIDPLKQPLSSFQIDIQEDEDSEFEIDV